MSTNGYSNRQFCSHTPVSLLLSTARNVLNILNNSYLYLIMMNCAVFSHKVIQGYRNRNIRLRYIHCWGGGFHCREYYVWELSSPGIGSSLLLPAQTGDHAIGVRWEVDVCYSLIQGSGQAVAVRVTADRCAFYNCRFLGWQVRLSLQLLFKSPQQPGYILFNNIWKL